MCHAGSTVMCILPACMVEMQMSCPGHMRLTDLVQIRSYVAGLTIVAEAKSLLPD